MFKKSNKKCKEQEPRDYKILFKQKYELSNISRRIDWRYTSCIISEDEKVLLQGRLRFCDGWEGRIYVHYYVVERNKTKYLKVVEFDKLESAVEDICTDYFEHIPWCETHTVGVLLPEYKKYALSITHEYKLDKKYDDLIKKMKDVDFSKYYIEDFTCQYGTSNVQYDCYDFVNHNIFYADGYCLRKFTPYVEFMDYVLSISDFKDYANKAIKVVDDLNVAYEEMVKRKEKDLELDIM